MKLVFPLLQEVICSLQCLSIPCEQTGGQSPCTCQTINEDFKSKICVAVIRLITADNQGVVTRCDAAGVLVHANQKILHYSCGIKLLGIIIAYINLPSYHSPVLRKQKPISFSPKSVLSLFYSCLEKVKPRLKLIRN